MLAVCHTCRVEKKTKTDSPGPAGAAPTANPLGNPFVPSAGADKNIGLNFEFQASSPDEKAFLEVARNYGFVYHGVEDRYSIISVNGEFKKFRVMHVLEFDSTRKCMSVLVQSQTGFLSPSLFPLSFISYMFISYVYIVL